MKYYGNLFFTVGLTAKRGPFSSFLYHARYPFLNGLVMNITILEESFVSHRYPVDHAVKLRRSNADRYFHRVHAFKIIRPGSIIRQQSISL